MLNCVRGMCQNGVTEELPQEYAAQLLGRQQIAPLNGILSGFFEEVGEIR